MKIEEAMNYELVEYAEPPRKSYRSLGEVLLTFERAKWMDEGACRDLKTDAFFGDTNSPKKSAVAKAVCSACPVRQQCLDYAIRNLEMFGVWGGHTTSERKKLRKEWEETHLTKDEKCTHT